MPDASAAGDWLLVHAAAGWKRRSPSCAAAPSCSTGTAPPDGAEGLADLVHQTAMYHQDRLGGRGFGRAVLAGEPCLEAAGAGRAAARRRVEERLGRDVEWLGAVVAPGVTDRTGADRTALDALAAPLGALLGRAPRELPEAAG